MLSIAFSNTHMLNHKRNADQTPKAPNGVEIIRHQLVGPDVMCYSPQNDTRIGESGKRDRQCR